MTNSQNSIQNMLNNTVDKFYLVGALFCVARSVDAKIFIEKVLIRFHGTNIAPFASVKEEFTIAFYLKPNVNPESDWGISDIQEVWYSYHGSRFYKAGR